MFGSGKTTTILDRYREALSYLDRCGPFDEAKFREFNRLTGNMFSEADVQNQLRNAQLMIGGMAEVQKILRSNMVEAIGTFETLEQQGIDLSNTGASTGSGAEISKSGESVTPAAAAPAEEAYGSPLPAVPEASPEKPARVLWAAGAVFGVMLVLCIGLIALGSSRVWTESTRWFMSAYESPRDWMAMIYGLCMALPALYTALLACSLCLLTREPAVCKAAGAGFAVAGLFLSVYGEAAGYLLLRQMRLPPFEVMTRFISDPPGQAMLMNTALWAAAVLLAGSLLPLALDKLPPRKRFALSAGGAAAAGFLLRLIGGFHGTPLGLRWGWGLHAYSPYNSSAMIHQLPFAYTLDLAAVFLKDGLLLALAALLAYSLCRLPGVRFRPGTGAKVWFGIVIGLNAVLGVATLFTGLDIVSLLLTAAALTGLVLMWGKRRAGWHVYLLAVLLSIAVNFTVSGGMTGDLRAMLPARLPSLLFALNPLITWAVIRRTWMADEA
ncbi:MAG: hypothetical protein FWH26_11565 [Oscillospiraceae bacterium]|nr:hypothetical protein [Oscillospiraceae bacterium]